MRAAPISYSSAKVNKEGKLENFDELLDQRIVQGYGCIWKNINSHQERFHRGAYAKSIKENGPGSGANYEIKFRDEHGRAMGLFDILEEDEIGLFFRTKPLDNVQWADDFLTQVRSGTINNFSNGFKYIFEQGAMKWNEQDKCVEIFKARLFEISGCAIPSDLGTFVLRSDDPEEFIDELEEFIKKIPRPLQLETRKMFARQKALIEPSSQEILERLKESNQPQERKGSIDYNYLTKNL